MIDYPNQVWCSDISYIPIQRGFMYLIVIIDWASRKILSWRISNTLDIAFCIEALEETLSLHNKPEIFNTDQGSQFTSFEWIKRLREYSIQISMNGKGRWRDNIVVERFWRTLKYECIYLNAFESSRELKFALDQWIHYYNHYRPHSALDRQTPHEVYKQTQFVLLTRKSEEKNKILAA